MAIFRRWFGTGRMNQDVNNMQLPQGEFREAVNAEVISSEGSSEGSLQKSRGNKRLTNLPFLPNPITIGRYEYEKRNRLYWLVKDDDACYICEWDQNSQTASFILKDSRPINDRVLDFREEYLCTAIEIIPTEDESRELMLISVGNLEPLCFNISRARTYGESGFDAEDIFLIKKPPLNAPITQMIATGSPENNIEERFITFCYRYKYLDGQFSAFSTFSNYRFIPKKFELDYNTFENLGMVNAFNAVRLGFDVGDMRVTDVQLIFKNSNSNTTYLVDTFNKKQLGWGDNSIQYYNFANNKLYTPLPEREFFRTFDNVPRNPVAMTVIGNKVFYSNYKEGYDLIDAQGNDIAVDFTLSVEATSLDGTNLPLTISDGTSEDNLFVFSLSGINLKTGTRLSFNLVMNETTYDNGTYNQSADFILNIDYAGAAALAADEDFITFITESLTNNFAANYDADPPENSSNPTVSGFTIVASSGSTITIQGASITYTIDDTPGNPDDNVNHTEVSYWAFDAETGVVFYENESGASIKTNRSVEACLIYEDKWGRKSTALTSLRNTVFIPQQYSTFKNALLVTVNNLPPYWADRCRVVVKSEPLTYYTLYCSVFYEDGPFRWFKLEGGNIDKVMQGDRLIVKKDLTGPIGQVIKVMVLEVTQQDENFISGNNNDQGSEIIEPAGLYMKIKPNGFLADYNESTFIVDEANADAQSGTPVARVDQLYTDNGDDTYPDLVIPQGSRITLYFKSFGRDQGPFVFEKTYTVQSDYDNFEDWFNNNITLPLEVPDSTAQYSDITFVRGVPFGNNGVTPGTGTDSRLFMKVRGIIAGNGSTSTGRKGYLNVKVSIQIADSLVIFETETEVTDVDLYYETEQTFLIKNNYLSGNMQEQNESQPAIIRSNFFNCYAMGNGAESYRVKDAVNKKFLRTDLKPTAVDPNGYREVRRSCDITYSEAFNESSNINGLNVFNLSTANFKDNLEKMYGSVQKLWAREGDIVVLQEEKSGRVLYNKNAIYTADGNPALISMPGVLGEYNTYLGSYGIAKHPESFSEDNMGRIKFASPKSGAFVRLSLDGIEPLLYGLENRFRNIFLAQPNAKMISGYDPYFDKTFFTLGNEPQRLVQFGCGTQFVKELAEEPFIYELKLNNLGGEVVVNYDVSFGNATISVVFNGQTYVMSNVSGIGNVSFERDSLVENIVTVTITPVGGPASFTMQNSCPVGTQIQIVSVVLNDSQDSGQTMIDRFKWNASTFSNTDELFTDGPLTRFETITGIEGQGFFPVNGALVTIQAFKDSSNSGHFSLSECNRLGYLVSDINYTQDDYLAILSNPDTQFITVTQSGEEGFAITNSGSFVFNRMSVLQKLYLIWDYTGRNPVLQDDSANVTLGGDVTINVLANDEFETGSVVTIGTEPQYGTVIVNEDNTITYTHDGTRHFEDSFTYVVTDNGCSSTATVSINIGIVCGDSFNTDGLDGIYEVNINLGTDTGWAGIQYNAQSVPDRFQIFRSGVLVADSKFVGDGITAGPPPSYSGLLGPKTLSVYTYNGETFTDTGVDESITILQDDIANNTTEPMDGNGILLFNKNTALPATVTLRVIGATGGTSWNLDSIICPTPEELLVPGEDKFLWGLFPEANKGGQYKSIRAWLGTSPVKFYTSKIGGSDFGIYNNFSANPNNNYINDGTRWWSIDVNGNILSTGLL